jgi:hypothetical protein
MITPSFFSVGVIQASGTKLAATNNPAAAQLASFPMLQALEFLW